MPVWRVWNSEQLLLPSGKRYDVLVTDGEVGTYPLTALSYHQGCVVCPKVTLATISMKGVPILNQRSFSTSLLPRHDLGGLEIDSGVHYNFSSIVEENRYMIDDKVFDPYRINQQVRLGQHLGVGASKHG